MGTQLYIGTDLRIANDVTFMPGGDANKHHVIVTAICNRGKSQAGKDLRDEISLNFWGKRAQNAAHYLYKGKQVNIKRRPNILVRRGRLFTAMLAQLMILGSGCVSPEQAESQADAQTVSGLNKVAVIGREFLLGHNFPPIILQLL